MHDIDLFAQIGEVERVAEVLEGGAFCCDRNTEHWHRNSTTQAKRLRAAAESLRDLWRRMEAEMKEANARND